MRLSAIVRHLYSHKNALLAFLNLVIFKHIYRGEKQNSRGTVQNMKLKSGTPNHHCVAAKLNNNT